jgi:hypothetical protein
MDIGFCVVQQESGTRESGSVWLGPDAQGPAILEQEDGSSLGCMSTILHPFASSPPKRFIRTIKPVAGSSFNVSRIPAEACNALHS